MGYKVNSPVTQIWLPFDYNFLSTYNNNSFATFAEAYRKEYGIDFHELFDLFKESENFYIVIKKDLIGAYEISNYFGVKSKFALPQAVTRITTGAPQSTGDQELLLINLHMENSGYGIWLALPPSTQVVNSIDDLIIKYNEI